MKKIVITLTEKEGKWSSEVVGRTGKGDTDKIKDNSHPDSAQTALSGIVDSIYKILEWLKRIEG
jgi:hypothetical protein